MHSFPESDWKILTSLLPVAQERLYLKIMRDAGKTIAEAEPNSQREGYLRLRKCMIEWDETLTRCFGDWRRSMALQILLNWQQEQLLTEDEFGWFSEETRKRITQTILDFSL